jgi:hypothetical protein
MAVIEQRAIRCGRIRRRDQIREFFRKARIEHDGLEFGFRQTNVWDCFVALLSVEYRLSPLGQSALGPLAGLIDWAERSFAEIKAARAAFDAGDTSEQMSAA